jgi:hypothetical protein
MQFVENAAFSDCLIAFLAFDPETLEGSSGVLIDWIG